MDLNSVFPRELVTVLVVLFGSLCFALFYFRVRSWKVPFYPFYVVSQRSFKVFVENFLLLKRVGLWCEERAHTLSRALVLYGFFALFVCSVANYALNTSALTPLKPQNPLAILSDASSALVFFGGFSLLLRRLLNKRRREVTHADVWCVQALLSVFGATGALYPFFGGFVGITLYALHFVFLFLLLVVAPFTELAFLVWKGSFLIYKESRVSA